MDTQTLKQFGLSDKEAAVYSDLLSMWPSVVSEIASRSKINRATAYDILESLVGYGLVGYVKDIAEAARALYTLAWRAATEIAKDKS